MTARGLFAGATVAVVLALIVGLLILVWPKAPLPANVPPPAPSVLQEDDPGWDCAVDGNRICGPLTDVDYHRRALSVPEVHAAVAGAR